MKKLIFNKKGDLMWGKIVSILLILAVLVFSGKLIHNIYKTSEGAKIKDSGLDIKDDFRPYDSIPLVQGNDAIALNSVNALIEGINSLSEGNSLNKYKDDVITLTDIKNYRITYQSDLHIEDQYGAFDWGNHYPTWSFTKKNDVILKSPKVNEFLISADYNYNWCSKTDSENKQCSFLYSPSYSSLITCKCDGQPDLPYGDNFGYLPEDKRAAAQAKIIPQIREVTKVSKIKIEVEYKNGDVCSLETDNSFNDLLMGRKYSSQNDCLESPIWLECRGIKIFYCGSKNGFLGNDMMSTNYYLFDKDKNIHSSAGAYFSVKVDDTFTEKKKSRLISNFSETNVMGLKIKEQTPNAFPNSQNFDRSDCQGGKPFGNATIKCNGLECNLCNFELPQDIAKESPVDYIAGYGDPKYVLYYESFPFGEEESWNIDKSNVMLSAIVMEDAFFAIGGAVLGPKIKNIGRIFLGSKVMTKLGVRKTAESISEGLVKTGASGVKKALLLSPNSVKKLAKNVALKKDMTAVYTITDDLLKANTKNLDDLVKVIEKDNSMKAALQTYSEEVTKSLGATIVDRGIKYQTAFWIASMAYESEIKNQKFVPIGMDNIGLKIENNPTAISGYSAITDLNSKSTYNYIVLTKDKSTFSRTKNYQRFYLASPCKADLRIYQTECSCQKPIGSENAFVYYNYNTNEWSNEPFPSGNQVLITKTSIDEDTNEMDISNAIKLCDTFENSLTATKTAHIKTQCIIVEPKIKSGFCYAGNDHSAAIGVAGLAANLGLSLGVNVIFPGAGFFAQVGIDAATAFITNIAEKTTKWPNHP